MVSGWKWNFDDPASGTANASIMAEPEHVFTSGGTHNIRLIGQTTEGCADTLVKTIPFHTRPVGSFTWTSECFDVNSPILFVSTMKSGEAITSYQWTFVNGGGTATGVKNDTATYTFGHLGTYTVRLQAETSGGCGNTAEKTISLKPMINLRDHWPYLETFNSDSGAWSTGQADTSTFDSWNYSKIGFSHSDSNVSLAWHTIVPGEMTPEQSYLMSPCFDFSEVEKPMVSMDIFRSLETDKAGVVLQAKTDSISWQNVGVPGDGINWYNTDQIQSAPAGQQIGWTGNSYSGSGDGWVNARHDLDFLTGKSNVQFRFAYASNHTGINEEGFGFDNFSIRSRDRTVLLEHFTNASDAGSKSANSEVNPLYNRFFDDVVKLEYHTEFPGTDPLNAINPAMPATRGLFYGITTVPYSVIDGGTRNELRYNYSDSASSPHGDDIRIESLQTPDFSMDLSVDQGNNNLTASVKVTALRNLPAEERIVQLVIFEKLITGVNGSNGETRFLNVAKDMLPNAAGTAVFDSWTEGQSRTWNYNWDYADVYNPDMVRVAAFIQSDLTGQVYQAVSNDTTKITTGTREVHLTGPAIRIYPNPASDILNVTISEQRSETCFVDIMDMAGRIVMSEQVYRDETTRQFSLNALSKGIYFVRVRNARGTTWNVTKLVVMK